MFFKDLTVALRVHQTDGNTVYTIWPKVCGHLILNPHLRELVGYPIRKPIGIHMQLAPLSAVVAASTLLGRPSTPRLWSLLNVLHGSNHRTLLSECIRLMAIQCTLYGQKYVDAQPELYLRFVGYPV